MDYPIDYSLYSKEEIIDIIEFLNLLERYHDSNNAVSPTDVLKAYHIFSTIVNNKAEEKKIDAAFEKQTGFSIYKTIKELKSTHA